MTKTDKCELISTVPKNVKGEIPEHLLAHVPNRHIFPEKKCPVPDCTFRTKIRLNLMKHLMKHSGESSVSDGIPSEKATLSFGIWNPEDNQKQSVGDNATCTTLQNEKTASNS